MTKLTQDIINAFPVSSVNAAEHAKLAAEVCKGYIERALMAGFQKGLTDKYMSLHTKQIYFKSEGITE